LRLALSSNQTLLDYKTPANEALTPFQPSGQKMDALKSGQGHSMAKSPFVHQIFLLHASAKVLFGRVELCRDGKELSK
jgi:hypothetical protein